MILISWFQILSSLSNLNVRGLIIILYYVFLNAISSFFSPPARSKSAKVKACYKREYVNVEADMDLVLTGPMFKGSTVFM